jgi:hypothetical protein
MYMNELAYPIPIVAPSDLSSVGDVKIVAHVCHLLNCLPRLPTFGTSFDPVADWAKEHFGDEASRVLDVSFKLLFVTLRKDWDQLDKPLAALENLVIDFRSSPWVIASSGSLLQTIAGISEYDGEDVNEQRHRRDRIYSMISTDVVF